MCGKIRNLVSVVALSVFLFLQKLESQIRDIAYGTKQYKPLPSEVGRSLFVARVYSLQFQCVLFYVSFFHFFLSFFFFFFLFFLQDSEYEEADSVLELERGQNVFEIHVSKVRRRNRPKCLFKVIFAFASAFAFAFWYLLCNCHNSCTQRNSSI